MFIICLTTVLSAILAVYSIKIGRRLKEQTGRRPRTGLIFIHIANMVVLILAALAVLILLLVLGGLFEEQDKSCPSKLKITKLEYYLSYCSMLG